MISEVSFLISIPSKSSLVGSAMSKVSSWHLGLVGLGSNGARNVKIWIIENQFGRRNLQPYTKTNLALQLEPLIAFKAKANQSLSDGRGKKGCQISDNLNVAIDTKKEIAKVADVSHDTVAKVN